MKLRTFKVKLEVYQEFKDKIRSVKLTGGRSLSVGQVLRALITMYLNGTITNQQVIYTVYVSEEKE